jgi:hypothetical protein
MSELSLEDALVAQLARSAVTEAAPEELPLFRPTSEAYFDDPAALEQDRPNDEMLGFGVEAVLILVTPIALRVARDVLNFVVDEIKGHTREAGSDVIDKLAGRLLRRDGKRPETAAEAAEPDELELTHDQLEQVRTLALEKAQLLKLPRDKAQLLADSLVGSLATA